MTDILELAKRVEALDGPDREIDRAIRQVFGHAWDYTADWDRLNTSTGIKKSNPVAKPYTASLGAAMTLGDDDWQRADALCTAMQSLGNPDYMKDGAWLRLLPIRTVAAILRAKEATNG